MTSENFFDAAVAALFLAALLFRGARQMLIEAAALEGRIRKELESLETACKAITDVTVDVEDAADETGRPALLN
ncbi:MAG: hypothetical protein JSR99_09945 [Proteobacteria bacterium]|nr:hypothetical protein [Pseudomonadota bacterium]